MKKMLAVLCIAFTLQSCFKVPISGRRQMNLLPESTMIGMSITSYKEFLTKNPSVAVGDAQAQMVKNVGAKIQSAVNRYLGQKKMSDRVKGYKWEFNLVNDNTVNAWCMPGGKVVVYSGLLPVTQDEAGLAVVMGHEIAHAIARHGNERMSQGLLVQLGGLGLQVAMSQKPQETQNIFLQSYGVASTLGTLKYSRVHESEADKMGLVFMAMAGYDPSVAISFWERMAKQGGAKTLEILSTHPSDETRIKDIKAYLPEAQKYYKKS
ncbi:MAG: M48 family metallopeptidase [Bacteroidetes bacterium]|nr:M48 family metallopeptidase [Bacteroidota bacterium]